MKVMVTKRKNSFPLNHALPHTAAQMIPIICKPSTINSFVCFPVSTFESVEFVHFFGSRLESMAELHIDSPIKAAKRLVDEYSPTVKILPGDYLRYRSILNSQFTFEIRMLRSRESNI